MPIIAIIAFAVHPPPPRFSETENRSKTAFRVSEKHTPLPNLCHTHSVTATNRQRAGGGARIFPIRGAWRERRGSNICEAIWPGGTLRVVTTRGPSQSPRPVRIANDPEAAFPKAQVRCQAPGCVCENAAEHPSATRVGHTLRAEPRPGVETAQTTKEQKGTERNIVISCKLRISNWNYPGTHHLPRHPHPHAHLRCYFPSCL